MYRGGIMKKSKANWQDKEISIFAKINMVCIAVSATLSAIAIFHVIFWR